MDGLGTEGAALAIAMILAKVVWDQLSKRKLPGNPHNPLCVERKDQMDRLEAKLEKLTDEVTDLKVTVAEINRGG